MVLQVRKRECYFLHIFKFCFLYYSSYRCVRTDKCDYKKTSKSNEYKCCPGFTTAPSPTDYHHRINSKSAYYLKKNGCPRGKRVMLQGSVNLHFCLTLL